MGEILFFILALVIFILPLITVFDIEKIKKYDQKKEPLLQMLIDPLQDITNYLKKEGLEVILLKRVLKRIFHQVEINKQIYSQII